MYFCIAKNTYMGCYQDDVIILDSAGDNYFNITGELAKHLPILLNEEFKLVNNVYMPVNKIPETYNREIVSTLVHSFKEKGFIQEVETRSPCILSQPLMKGGLVGYRWDTKSALAPFGRTSKLDILSSLCTLYKVHTHIKNGLGQVIDEVISQRDPDREYRVPSEAEIIKLSDAVDSACTLYFKKVYCLGWAATFTIEALKKGWCCNFVIGAQSIPFYAHAWAEIENKVINDSPHVQQYLTILLRKPFGPMGA